MSVSQISVFLESRIGRLSRILDAFETARVNVRGFSASDTGDYGIVRFIVDNPDAAIAVLEERGAACVRAEVLCMRLADEPGELARLVSILTRLDANILYCYSMISTYVVIAVADVAEVERRLAAEDVDLVSQADIAALCADGAGR